MNAFNDASEIADALWEKYQLRAEVMGAEECRSRNYPEPVAAAVRVNEDAVALRMGPYCDFYCMLWGCADMSPLGVPAMTRYMEMNDRNTLFLYRD